ncbi:GNAT family N-acetyltransferase [Lysinibacillus sp. NPDC097195]|uniref:GNAT family N-acetyltransferase n=1 Tax=Lysinibacillus sp. NPDC097195 TaxID=3364141 RepID=UPI0037FBD5E5
MEITIQRTTEDEATVLLAIQKEAFLEDLTRYHDHETNPANETISRLRTKIQNYTHFTIWLQDEIIGGIDIRELNNHVYRLNRIYLAKAQQNKGFGSHIMHWVENQFSCALEWHLDTPHLNTRNHHFYEKLGYQKVGEHRISETLLLFDYVKKVEK